MQNYSAKHTQIVFNKKKEEERGTFINFAFIPLVYGLIGLFVFFFLMDNILTILSTFQISLTDYDVSFIGFIYGFIFGIIQGLIDKYKR